MLEHLCEGRLVELCPHPSAARGMQRFELLDLRGGGIGRERRYTPEPVPQLVLGLLVALRPTFAAEEEVVLVFRFRPTQKLRQVRVSFRRLHEPPPYGIPAPLPRAKLFRSTELAVLLRVESVALAAGPAERLPFFCRPALTGGRGCVEPAKKLLHEIGLEEHLEVRRMQPPSSRLP